MNGTYNLILTGAPGTGKTYLAKQIATQMILGKEYDEKSASDEEKEKMEEPKSNNNDMIVIKNIVKMVGELNMNIIAEGVETNKEMTFLREVNCDMAQGYLFDKPMPHDDYEYLLKGRRNYEKEI